MTVSTVRKLLDGQRKKTIEEFARWLELHDYLYKPEFDYVDVDGRRDKFPVGWVAVSAERVAREFEEDKANG